MTVYLGQRGCRHEWQNIKEAPQVQPAELDRVLSGHAQVAVQCQVKVLLAVTFQVRGESMNYAFTQLPKPNIEVGWEDGGITFEFNAKRTLLNRVKFCILCFFFPFFIKRWD